MRFREPLIKSRPADLVLILLVFFRQIALKILEIRRIPADFSNNLPEKILRNMSTRFNQCLLRIRSFTVLFFSNCLRQNIFSKCDKIKLNSDKKAVLAFDSH